MFLEVLQKITSALSFNLFFLSMLLIIASDYGEIMKEIR